MKSWLTIAALVALWMFFRQRKGPASPAVKDGTVDVPAGAQIGQIGARIENPQALSDFAQALETSSAPRILDVFTIGNRVYRTWTDGRYQILQGDDGTGQNPTVLYDSAFSAVGDPMHP